MGNVQIISTARLARLLTAVSQLTAEVAQSQDALSIAEAARLLGISKRQTNALAQSGRLEAIDHKGYRYISAESVSRLLAERRANPAKHAGQVARARRNLKRPPKRNPSHKP